MTDEIRLMGESCNLACTYCYQEGVREAGNVNVKYDLDKVMQELEKSGREFSMFGGEALLVPKKDLEFLFDYGFKKFGRNGIQTNGTLIDDGHIEMFKKYNVGVGISIDGPADLNNLRKVRGKGNTDEKTLKATEATMENIFKLRQNGIGVSVIITLHRLNGNPEALPRILKFMRWLGDIGIMNGNLHALEVDKTMPDQSIHVLSQKENAEAFLTIAKFLIENPDLRWSPFEDMKNILDAKEEGSNCTWHFCDPMNTQAVYGIEGDGAISNCGRTNKEGVGWYKTEGNMYGRYIALYNTPDEQGGCKGCRFWMACGGSCPGESMDNDFRNKTIHCHTQYTMLSFYESELNKQGKVAITLSPIRELIERVMINDMTYGERPSIPRALRILNSKTNKVTMLEAREEE